MPPLDLAVPAHLRDRRFDGHRSGKDLSFDLGEGRVDA
jgi:hypothetical protein